MLETVAFCIVAVIVGIGGLFAVCMVGGLIWMVVSDILKAGRGH